MSEPYPIEPRQVGRPWGMTDLSPWYVCEPGEIGEVWFQSDSPMLVKFIFAKTRLSLQVHPDDEYAGRHEQCRGKTEMWHILKAEPGAQVGLGLTQVMSKQEVRAKVEAGEIGTYVRWTAVKPGDTYFVPAGVIHAIGAGITLCEIQQNSDITYRLYDYGSDRPLHLDKGLEVAKTEPYHGDHSLPVKCPHFEVDELRLQSPATSDIGHQHLLITLEGTGTIAGKPFAPGQVWVVPSAAAVAVDTSARLLRASCPSAE